MSDHELNGGQEVQDHEHSPKNQPQLALRRSAQTRQEGFTQDHIKSDEDDKPCHPEENTHVVATCRHSYIKLRHTGGEQKPRRKVYEEWSCWPL